MESFDIYFLGEMLPDADPAMVRTGVAKLFKVQETAVERLFSGKPLRVKQGVDAESASRYRSAFRDIGALIQIVAAGSPPPTVTAKTTPAVQPEPDEQAMPPLVEVEEGVSFDLAEPGAIIDHSKPAAPADIDTGTLEALPPNTGSLEDCRHEKPPRKIPDISHLKLVDD